MFDVLVTNVGAWALDPSTDINVKLTSPNTALGLNNIASAQDHRALDSILKLAHVSGP